MIRHIKKASKTKTKLNDNNIIANLKDLKMHGFVFKGLHTVDTEWHQFTIILHSKIKVSKQEWG